MTQTEPAVDTGRGRRLTEFGEKAIGERPGGRIFSTG